MSHDKIRAAARKRMAQTGEPYATARREVIRQHQRAPSKTPAPGTGWFTISFSKAGFDRITTWLDTLFGGGPGRSGVQVGPPPNPGPDARLQADRPAPFGPVSAPVAGPARGTTGVHASRGQLLVNGSADGLVELTLDSPCYTGRTLNTMFVNQKVTSLIVSLADPDGFIAAVEGHGHT